MKISIIIPLHNEKNHIINVLKSVSKHKLPIVVVDDGSTDGSFKEISRLRINNLTILSHKINLGKGAAMKTGADFAFRDDADAVIFMDADGQHDVKNINSFIEKISIGGCDVIFGSRNLSYGVPLVRYLGNKIGSIIMAIFFRIYVSDAICGFRAITKNGYKKIRWESNGYGVEIEMVARVGKNHIHHCEVPVETIYNDNVKGVTILDAFGILLQVIKWRLTL